MMQAVLFDGNESDLLPLAEGAVLLAGFCLENAPHLWELVLQHLDRTPAQTMVTPMGRTMSVKTSSMGQVGWVSDHLGYRYSVINPATNKTWPAIPTSFMTLAKSAAMQAGYADFEPDSCLINLYHPKAKMGLHRDKDELDFSYPIVSVSLGVDATFLFGGASRSDSIQKCLLRHGDVVVFGGASRLFYHGVAPVTKQNHPLTGLIRCNLTFRRAK